MMQQFRPDVLIKLYVERVGKGTAFAALLEDASGKVLIECSRSMGFSEKKDWEEEVLFWGLTMATHLRREKIEVLANFRLPQRNKRLETLWEKFRFHRVNETPRPEEFKRLKQLLPSRNSYKKHK